ncbi:hypothetical protein ACHAO4_006808 [Trichoderma viride]
MARFDFATTQYGPRYFPQSLNLCTSSIDGYFSTQRVKSLDIKSNAVPLNPKRRTVAAAPSFAAPARLTTTSVI